MLSLYYSYKKKEIVQNYCLSHGNGSLCKNGGGECGRLISGKTRPERPMWYLIFTQIIYLAEIGMDKAMQRGKP